MEKNHNKLIFLSREKRKRKMLICQSNIDHVKCVDIIDFDHEECKMIQEMHKKLLNHAMHHNNSNEVGMVVELCNEWLYTLIKGTEDGISIKNVDAIKELMETSPRNSLLFFHNHPKNSLFSERDLDSFISSDAIKMISVIGNNGQLYFLVKLENFSKETALIKYDEIFNKIEDEKSKLCSYG